MFREFRMHCTSMSLELREEDELPYLAVVSHWISSVPLWNLTEASKTKLGVSVFLVEQFPSWNVAHQQYLRSLVQEYCPCCGWMDCMPHLGMLSLQTGRLVSTRYYKASSLQECITAMLNPVISPDRPSLAYREPAADHTPRYAQSWKQLSGLSVALFLRLLFSPIS